MPRSKKRLARKNRRNSGRATLRLAPFVEVTGTGAGSPTTSRVMTFSGAIMLTGAPTGITADGEPVTLTQVNSTVVNLAGAGTLSGNDYDVPDMDPAIRTPQGGYVRGADGTF